MLCVTMISAPAPTCIASFNNSCLIEIHLTNSIYFKVFIASRTHLTHLASFRFTLLHLRTNWFHFLQGFTNKNI